MIRRSITATSFSSNIPFSNVTYLDFDGQNEIFSWILSNLKSADLLKVEEKLIDWVPNNPHLIYRSFSNSREVLLQLILFCRTLCDFWKKRDVASARSIAQRSSAQLPLCLPIVLLSVVRFEIFINF